MVARTLSCFVKCSIQDPYELRDHREQDNEQEKETREEKGRKGKMSGNARGTRNVRMPIKLYLPLLDRLTTKPKLDYTVYLSTGVEIHNVHGTDIVC